MDKVITYLKQLGWEDKTGEFTNDLHFFIKTNGVEYSIIIDNDGYILTNSDDEIDYGTGELTIEGVDELYKRNFKS